MIRRSNRGWLTIEQLRTGLVEQAAVTEPGGVVASVTLEHQDDVLGGGFYVIATRRRGAETIERHEYSYDRVDEARDRFTHTQRRFTRPA